MKKIYNSNYFYWFWFLIFLILDQLSKWWVIGSGMNYTKNVGVAFSLPIEGVVLVFVYLIVLSLLIWFWFSNMQREYFLSKLVISLVVAGAIGNIVDRVWYGGVVDFIFLGFWPAFNFADTYLTVAGILFILFAGKILR